MFKVFAYFIIFYGGFVRFEYFGNTDDPYNIKKIGATFSLREEIQRENAGATFIMNFILNDLDTEKVMLLPIEAYVNYSYNWLNIYAGKKIYNFGYADWFNPTDFITPFDYSVLFSSLEEMKRGITSISVEVSPKPEYEFGIYILPFFTAHKIPFHYVKISPQSPFQPVTIFNPEKSIYPERNLKNTQFAIKTGLHLGNFDMNLIFFKGYDPYPDFQEEVYMGQLSKQPTIDSIVIFPIYDTLMAGGLNLSYIVSKFKIYFEGAYYLTKDKDGIKPGIKNPYFYGVFGIQRVFFDKLSVNIQYISKIIKDFKEPEDYKDIMDQEFAEMSNQYFFQNYEKENTFSSRISYQTEDMNFRAEVFGAYNFEAEDYIIMPRVTYRFTDQFSASIGAMIFSEKEKVATPFSMMGKMLGDLIFTEAKFNF